MNLAQAAQHAPPEARVFSKFTEESEELVRQLSQEIRTMSYLLHPPLLDETGLSEALRWYIQGLSERSGLEIVLDIPADFERLAARNGTGHVPPGAGMPDQYSSSQRERDGRNSHRP